MKEHDVCNSSSLLQRWNTKMVTEVNRVFFHTTLSQNQIEVSSSSIFPFLKRRKTCFSELNINDKLLQHAVGITQIELDTLITLLLLLK